MVLKWWKRRDLNPRPKIIPKRHLASLVRFFLFKEKNKNLTKIFFPENLFFQRFSDSTKNTKACDSHPFKKRQAFLKRRCFKQQPMQVEMFCWHFCLPGLNAVPYGLQALFSQIFVESFSAPFIFFLLMPFRFLFQSPFFLTILSFLFFSFLAPIQFPILTTLFYYKSLRALKSSLFVAFFLKDN